MEPEFEAYGCCIAVTITREKDVRSANEYVPFTAEIGNTAG
jgi:hypothetical protein